MVHEIRQIGDPVLRAKARALTREEILDPATQELIASMRETMYAAPGVGLAAPQIGVSLQIAVIEDKAEYIARIPPDESEARLRRPVPFHVIINPVLTPEGDEFAEFAEGCLSVRGRSAVTPRALRVHVECLNERAEPVSIHAAGWYARILQHEIDHLSGILYVDRIPPQTPERA